MMLTADAIFWNWILYSLAVIAVWFVSAVVQIIRCYLKQFDGYKISIDAWCSLPKLELLKNPVYK